MSSNERETFQVLKTMGFTKNQKAQMPYLHLYDVFEFAEQLQSQLTQKQKEIDELKAKLELVYKGRMPGRQSRQLRDDK